MQGVEGKEVDVGFRVSGFPINAEFEFSGVTVDADVKERDGVVGFPFMCELDTWGEGVQFCEETWQFFCVVWPGGKDVVYVSYPNGGFGGLDGW